MWVKLFLITFLCVCVLSTFAPHVYRELSANVPYQYNSVALLAKACDEMRWMYRMKGDSIIIHHNHKVETVSPFYYSFNDGSVRHITRKHNTTRILEQCGLPVPRQQTVHLRNKSVKTIVQMIRIPYPVVVKPVDGEGGQLVFINIRSPSELGHILRTRFLSHQHTTSDPWAATYVFKKKKLPQTIVIEEFVRGEDYRILCYKNKIIDIFHRVRPYVVGDGVHTLRELVRIKTSKVTVSTPPPVVDTDYVYNVARKSLEYVPKSRERVVVNPIPTRNRGSETRRVNVTLIHPDNRRLFERVNTCMGLTLCGIDFIIPDITKSYKMTRAAINEINAAPGLKPHYYADNGDTILPIKTLLQLHFNSN